MENRTERPSMIRILREWFFKSAPTVPSEPVPVVARRRSDFGAPRAGALEVTWLGHSTALIDIDGTRVLLDPVWAERASPVQFAGPKRFFDPPIALDELPDPDVVLLSHDHYDHLDKATVRVLARRGIRFIVPTGVGERFRKWGIDTEQVTEVAWWDEIQVGEVTITATPAQHFSGRSMLMTDRNRTHWCGFALRGPERSLYYAGDTGWFDGFTEIGEALGPFEMTLIEVGAYNRLWTDIHIGPEQGVRAVRTVQGGLMIPVHWGTFDLAMHGWTEPIERVLAAAAKQGVPVAVPRPGETVDPSDPPSVERWWPNLPWQTAEEHPIVAARARPTRSGPLNAAHVSRAG
ncbi:MAG: MBL fold metallo-hydrolase [Gemmatimonadota bacterium]